MAVRKFGIFSPVLGKREDIPSVTIPQVFTVDNENIIFRYGEIRRAKMRSAVLGTDNTKLQTPDGYPVLKYHWYEKAGGTDYLLAFTKAHVYHWRNDIIITGLTYDHTGGSIERKLTGSNNDFTGLSVGDSVGLSTDGGVATGTYVIEAVDTANHAFVGLTADGGLTGDGSVDAINFWDLKFTCGSDCEEWSVVTYYNKLYATNNIDKIQIWEGTDDFENLGGADGITVATATYLIKARFLVSFGTYLMAWNVTVGGAACPQVGYWCDTTDANTWDSGNAGNMPLPGPEGIRAAGQVDDYLCVFTGRSIDLVWEVPDTLVFNRRRIKDGTGTFAPGSLVNDVKGALYFLDQTKNIRQISSVMGEFRVISLGVDKTVREVLDSLLTGICSFRIEEYEQVCWSIPYGPDATANNKVILLDSNGAWTTRDMAVTAFGRFENKTTWTINTVPFDTIDENGWDTIDSVEANANFRLDICGDGDGYTYNLHDSEKDDGSDYTGYGSVSTDFSQGKGTPALDYYKRLLEITVICRNTGSGTLDLSIRRDTETSWQSVGSVDLDGSGEFIFEKLPCDYRFRSVETKVSGDNPFGVVGLIFSYVSDGFR